MSKVQIAGNTYACRELIKGRGGRWDAAAKTWAIDEAAWAILANLDNGRATRDCYVVRDATPATARAYQPAHGINQPCRKCGSYCFGDCEAN